MKNLNISVYSEDYHDTKYAIIYIREKGQAELLFDHLMNSVTDIVEGIKNGDYEDMAVLDELKEYVDNLVKVNKLVDVLYEQEVRDSDD